MVRVSPFWIAMQVVILVCILISAVIVLVRLT
jgi:hypothetical protein